MQGETHLQPVSVTEDEKNELGTCRFREAEWLSRNRIGGQKSQASCSSESSSQAAPARP